MEAYLDNAATTRTFPEVAELMTHIMCEDYGNPSSLHGKGVEAEKYVREAGDAIAATLKCQRGNIIFTSGGTESNNMAIIGAAMALRRRGKHIITTCFEHAAVYQPCVYLEEVMGFEVTYLPVDSMGHVKEEDLRAALREDTILVSIMMVNNEVGAILDIKRYGEMIREYREDIAFHVDAIQAYGKMRIQPAKCNIDFLSVSGHKIHGPKGTGFLYISDRMNRQGKCIPLIHGGGQQKGWRSGTENVPGIAGLGLAAKKMYQDLSTNVENMYSNKEYLVEQLLQMPGVTVNAVDAGRIKETAPHVVSVSVEKVRSEVLLHALEDRGVYVSSGSACSSNHPGISSTLQAIGVKKELLDSTIRLSFSVHTTKEELDYALAQMKELIPMLSRYVRK